MLSEVKQLIQSHPSDTAGFQQRSQSWYPSKCRLFPFVILLAENTVQLLFFSH